MKISGKLNRFMFLLVLPAFIFTGCTSAERARMTVSSMQPVMDNMRSAVNRHNDVDLVKDAMPASLLQLDGFIEVSPGNPNLLIRAAEANSGYAFLFLADTDKNRALKFYQKSKNYAFRALRHKNAFAEVLKNGSDEEITRFMDRFYKADVPALYFFATCWLSCIELSDDEDVNVVADLPKVELILGKILGLDDTYNYGAIHAVFGTYFSSRLQELGGQMEDAKFHFEEAFEISESKFLAWQFLYAKSYAVQMKDRELFIKILEDIIAAPENLLFEKTFVNEAIKRNAKELLDKVDYLF